MTITSRVVSAVSVVWLITAASSPVSAQEVTVLGRVQDARTGLPVTAATATLGAALQAQTDGNGRFRFDVVRPGNYELTVFALGYVTTSVQLAVQADTVVVVSLTPDPIQLDSIVAGKALTLRGRLVDAVSGRAVFDGTVVLGGGRTTRSNRAGAFQFTLVPADIATDLRVIAFAYSPVRLGFTPQSDTSVVITLEHDTLTGRLISEQLVRLETRMNATTGRAGAVTRQDLFAAMNRIGDGTLDNALAHIAATQNYSARRSPSCYFLDEREVADPRAMLFPEDVERVEYLHDGAVVRIYTRRFMARMVTGAVRLGVPGFSEVPAGFQGRSPTPVAFCR